MNKKYLIIGVIVLIIIGLIFMIRPKKVVDNSNKINDSLNKNIVILQAKYDSLEREKNVIKRDLESLEIRVIKAEQTANESKLALDKVRSNVFNILNDIKVYKNNPPTKEGDLLLESIKNKTKE